MSKYTPVLDLPNQKALQRETINQAETFAFWNTPAGVRYVWDLQYRLYEVGKMCELTGDYPVHYQVLGIPECPDLHDHLLDYV